LAVVGARYVLDWFIPPWLLRRVAFAFVSGSTLFLAGGLEMADLLALAWAIVRDDAGHGSSAITDRYIDVERAERHATARNKLVKP
jgi:protein gp37